MASRLLCITIIIIALHSVAQAQDSSSTFSGIAAQDYKIAIGLRLSTASPTLSNGISFKYFVKQDQAIEAMVSFGGSRFGLGGLYEFHRQLNATPGLKWFYGGGAYFGFQDNISYTGPTGVVGLDYKFPQIPLNLSLDWKPELDILPAVNFVPDAFALSARFTIK